MHIVIWLIIGFFVGLVARAIVPGRDPMGLIGTTLLGIVGSLVGGFLGNLLFAHEAVVSPAGILGSIAGAVIVLLVFRATRRRAWV